MPGREHGDEDGKRPPVAGEAELSARLKALDARLAVHRRVEPEVTAGPSGPNMTGISQAMRMGAEFVAAMLVGAALGYFFDRLLGTSPWGLIGFVLFGFGAGILTVMRSAGLIAERGAGGPGDAGEK